jgi:hypothetical protein
MPDRFESTASGLDSPATHGFAITPQDAADLPEVTRALYVGGPGAISLVLLSGAEILLTGIAAGAILPVRASRIKASGTTATAIVGLV